MTGCLVALFVIPYNTYEFITDAYSFFNQKAQ